MCRLPIKMHGAVSPSLSVLPLSPSVPSVPYFFWEHGRHGTPFKYVWLHCICPTNDSPLLRSESAPLYTECHCIPAHQVQPFGDSICYLQKKGGRDLSLHGSPTTVSVSAYQICTDCLWVTIVTGECLCMAAYKIAAALLHFRRSHLRIHCLAK